MKSNSKWFPEVDERIEKVDSNYLSRKYAIYYPILLDYAHNVQKGNRIVSVLLECGIKKIGLYAANEFMELILSDPSVELFSELRLYDLNASRFENVFLGREVFGIENAVVDYNNNEITKIIICNLGVSNLIVDDLVSRGVDPSDIITLYDLIYNWS